MHSSSEAKPYTEGSLNHYNLLCSKYRNIAIVIIIFVSTSIYLNILFNGFVYDDWYLYVQNKWITDISHLPRILFSSSWSFRQGSKANTYRPLQHVIAMLEYRVFGIDPWGYHLTSIILYVLSVIVVFKLSLHLFLMTYQDKAFKNSRGDIDDGRVMVLASIAGLLFASHPIHTEAVAWASATTGIAMALMYFLSFYLYITYSSDSKRRLYLSLLVFFFALLFKETAITLPILIVAYDYTWRNIGFLRRRYKDYILYLLVIAVYMGFRLYSLKGFSVKKTIDLTGLEVIVNALPLFPRYIEKLILPVRLSVHYPLFLIHSLLDLRLFLALVFCLFYLTLLFLVRRKDKLVFFCLLFISIPLLPVFYLPGLGASAFAERYLFIPSAGYVILLTHLGYRVYLWISEGMVSKKALRLGAGIVALTMVGPYSFLTIERNFVWKDDYTLWSDTVKKQPLSGLAHVNLGVTYEKKGLPGKAIEEYRIAVKLHPEDIETRYALGVLYLYFDLTNEALAQFYKILAIDPANEKARERIRWIYSIEKEKNHSKKSPLSNKYDPE